MGLWDKLQTELDRAGNAARGALDEGKIRIEIFRVRQQADKAAQALGYAMHHATRDGREIEAELRDRMLETLSKYEAEAKTLEEQLAAGAGKTGSAAPPVPAPPAPAPPAQAPPAQAPPAQAPPAAEPPPAP